MINKVTNDPKVIRTTIGVVQVLLNEWKATDLRQVLDGLSLTSGLDTIPDRELKELAVVYDEGSVLITLTIEQGGVGIGKQRSLSGAPDTLRGYLCYFVATAYANTIDMLTPLKFDDVSFKEVIPTSKRRTRRLLAGSGNLLSNDEVDNPLPRINGAVTLVGVEILFTDHSTLSISTKDSPRNTFLPSPSERSREILLSYRHVVSNNLKVEGSQFDAEGTRFDCAASLVAGAMATSDANVGVTGSINKETLAVILNYQAAGFSSIPNVEIAEVTFSLDAEIS